MRLSLPLRKLPDQVHPVDDVHVVVASLSVQTIVKREVGSLLRWGDTGYYDILRRSFSREDEEWEIGRGQTCIVVFHFGEGAQRL